MNPYRFEPYQNLKKESKTNLFTNIKEYLLFKFLIINDDYYYILIVDRYGQFQKNACSLG